MREVGQNNILELYKSLQVLVWQPLTYDEEKKRIKILFHSIKNHLIAIKFDLILGKYFFTLM